ncbi:MAG: hypothetical protein AAB459_01620 [Patescibacteria group bacterium]
MFWRNSWGKLAIGAGVIALLLLILIAAKPAQATINRQMNFQGKLTNPDGTNVTDASRTMVFSIYTVSSGGTAVWTESKSVSTVDGIFRTSLGDTTALPGSIDFNGDSLYLGVTVAADAEMTPRVRLTATPYAFNSDTLDGLDSANYLQLAQGIQTDASSTNPSIAINKTGTAAILQLQDAGADVFSISGTGVFTITLDATDNPSYTITNAGSSNVVTNLSGTGDFVLQDNGSSFMTISDTGAFDYSLDATDNPTFVVTNNGSGNITLNLASTGDFAVQDNGTGVFTVNDTGSLAVVPTAGQAVTISLAAGSALNVSATAAPTVDLATISNSGQATTTAGANGLEITYVGGAAAVEGSGAHVALTPGGTAAGTWNGLRIVANGTGAAANVRENGIKLEGPTTPGAGTEVGLTIDANWDSALQLGSKTSDPGTPAADTLYLFARKTAGRSLFKQVGPSGVSFSYQPGLFEQAIHVQLPLSATNVTSIGSTWTVDTTASHPTATEQYGYATNFATAASANDTAGAGQSATMWFRGSGAGSNGYFYVARISNPDASYGAAGTGSRLFFGLTSGTIASMTNADNPAGDYSGFQFSTNRADANWQFILKGNTTQNVINTTLAFTVQKVYDMYIYVAPQGGTIFWRIDNLTDGTTREGSSVTNLPRTTIGMRAGAGIQTLTTTARNIRINKQYVEADR